MKYSLIKNGVVINRIVAANDQAAQTIADQLGATYTTDPGARKGYELVDGQWAAPDRTAERRKRMVASAAQFIVALDELSEPPDDYLGDVEAYMAADSTPKRHKLAWKKASSIHRNGQLVNSAADNLGWSDQFRDQLMEYAMKVQT